MRRVWPSLGFLVLLIALAQALSLDLKPYLIRVVEGKEIYEENPVAVKPGDVLERVRVVENGKEVEREVEVKPEEYTHVRWLIPELPKGGKVQVSLRTMVR